jgi:hypothetical protein
VNTASALRLAYLSVCRRFRFGHGVWQCLQLHDKDCVSIDKTLMRKQKFKPALAIPVYVFGPGLQYGYLLRTLVNRQCDTVFVF